MSDIFRFIWRGALGGVIMPLLLYAYFWIVPYGLLAIWYLPLILVYVAIPGGIVGAILWLFCSRVSPNIGPFQRLLIGAGVVSTIIVLLSLNARLGVRGNEAEVLSVLVWSLIYGTLIGGLAGL